MNDDIEKFIEDIFEISHDEKFEFKKFCGFIFVFKRTTYRLRGTVTSDEISPAGIIYEENDEIYLAPLDEIVEIEAIVKEFVKDYLN